MPYSVHLSSLLMNICVYFLLYLVRSCSIDNPGRSSLFWRGHGEIVLGERGGGGRIGSSGGRGKLCLKCVV